MVVPKRGAREPCGKRSFKANDEQEDPENCGSDVLQQGREVREQARIDNRKQDDKENNNKIITQKEAYNLKEKVDYLQKRGDDYKVLVGLLFCFGMFRARIPNHLLHFL